MIKQVFDVDGYWEVVVFYNVDYSLFYIIDRELSGIGYSQKAIADLYRTMSTNRAKAVTCSSTHQYISIVLFNRHATKIDYINSIVHEAEHIKQAMLDAYRVKDEGEPPAYIIGYLVGRMWEVVGKKLLGCD